MNLRSLLFQCSLLLIASLAQAQSSTVWWQSSFGSGSSNLEWKNVAVSENGQVAACTTEQGISSTLLVQCWNPDGSVRWIYRFPDSGNVSIDQGIDIGYDDLNNKFIVLGATNQGVGTAKLQTLVVRLDPSNGAANADILDIDPGTTVDEIPVDLDVTRTGTYILVNGQSDGYVVKLNNQNAIDFSTKIDSPNFDLGLMKICVNYDILVSGQQVNGFTGPGFVCKIRESSGAVIATQMLPIGHEVVDISNGTLVLTHDIVSGFLRVYWIAYDGSIEMFRDIVGGYFNGGSIATNFDENVYVVYQNSATEEMLALAFDYHGNVIGSDSVSNLAGPGRDYLLKTDRYGNPVVFGSTELNTGRVNLSAWCWDKMLNRQWHEELAITASADEFPRGLAIGQDLRLYCVGVSKDSNSSDQKALIWRIQQFYKSSANSFSVLLGKKLGGNTASLAEADNDSLVVCKFIVPNQSVQPINVEFQSAFPIENVLPGDTTLTLKITSKSNSSAIVQSVELWDAISSSWDNETITTLGAGFQLVSVPATGDISRYFDNGIVKCRARIKNIGPTTVLAYCGFFDEVRWESNPE